MVVHIKLLGCDNRPEMGLSRWFYRYFCEAANGLIEEVEDEDYIEDGDYELPDEDWSLSDDDDDDDEDE